MKKSFSLLLILSSLLLSVSCKEDAVDITGTIVGTVYDASTSQPLPGVQLTLTPLGKTTTTGGLGQYTFTDIDAKSYTITAMKSGYQQDTKDVTVEVGRESRLDFQLTTSNPMLELNTDILDFGTETTTMTFTVRNTGFAPLQWQASVSKDAQWLQCTPVAGTTQQGKESSVVVTVNRAELRFGTYTENIAIASNGGSSIVRVNIQVVGDHQVPTLETGTLSKTEPTQAEIVGTVVDLGSKSGISDYGHIWSTNGTNLTITTAQGFTQWGTRMQTGTFNSQLTGLSPHTHYFIRAYATNQYGTGYGEIGEFTTPYGDVLLTTTDVTDITHEAATCGGIITELGGHSLKEVGICWSLSANPTISDKRQAASIPANEFIVRMTGLDLRTYYHARAYAVTATNDVFYGKEVQFTSTDQMYLPQLSATTVTALGAHSAQLMAQVTSNGNGNVKEAGFVLSLKPQPTMSDMVVKCTTIATFSGRAKGLQAETTYFVRAYAINEVGTSFGEEMSFTTNAQGDDENSVGHYDYPDDEDWN